VFLHRPEAVFVAGEPAAEPRLGAVLRVEHGIGDGGDDRLGGARRRTGPREPMRRSGNERNPMRVWVFASEVPDGTWGALGQIVTLADVATFATGDAEYGRRYAEGRLGARRAAAVT
jgi:hypothetical protein